MQVSIIQFFDMTTPFGLKCSQHRLIFGVVAHGRNFARRIEPEARIKWRFCNPRMSILISQSFVEKTLGRRRNLNFNCG
jgi:hypothetical protein